MHPVKLFGRAADTAVRTIRHPLTSAAYAVGIARGLAGAALHGTEEVDGRRDAAPADVPTQRTTSPGEAPTGPRKPQRVPKPVPPPDAVFDTVVIEPKDEPGESFATEPQAVSRASAHGGTAPTDAEIDAWIDEAMARGEEREVRTPVGTTGADVAHNPHTGESDLQQPGTPPLLDPSLAKAIRSESEMLRKDAEVDPS